jgi:hypothetical protein
MDSASGHVSA